MNNEECIARMQQLSEEMYDLVRELSLSDLYQNALDDENRRLIEENRELRRELEILRAKTGRAQDFQFTKDDLKTKAIKLHETDGLSSYEIASRLGKPAKTIQTWLRNQKLGIAKEEMNFEGAITSLLDQSKEYGVRELARIVGCSPASAHYYKKRWLELHGTSEQGESQEERTEEA